MSHDLAGAMSLTAATSLLLYIGPSLLDSLRTMVQTQWTEIQLRPENLSLHVEAIWNLALLVVLLIVTFAAVSISTRLSQIGFLFLPQRALPSLERVDPFLGSNRIFTSGPTSLCFAAAKALVFCLAAWHFLNTNATALLRIAGDEYRTNGIGLGVVTWQARVDDKRMHGPHRTGRPLVAPIETGRKFSQRRNDSQT